MAHLQINLRASEKDALAKLAKEQRRDPRQQAALLIVEALRARGLLPMVNATPTDAMKPVEVPNAIAG